MDGFVPQTGHEGQTDFIYCCGLATELLRFGSCLSGCRLLFLVIPGESFSRLRKESKHDKWFERLYFFSYIDGFVNRQVRYTLS